MKQDQQCQLSLDDVISFLQFIQAEGFNTVYMINILQAIQTKNSKSIIKELQFTNRQFANRTTTYLPDIANKIEKFFKQRFCSTCVCKTK